MFEESFLAVIATFGMIFSAGGYPNTVTSGKQASHYQYTTFVFTFFFTQITVFWGFDPISKHDFLFSELFLFQNPRLVVDDDSTSLPLQEAKTVAAVASPSHAPKFGRVDGCRSFRCGEPVVFVSGSFIFQGFWDGRFSCFFLPDVF